MAYNSKAIFKLLTFLVISAFLTFIILYTYNLPKGDDFDSPLNALMDSSQSSGILNYLQGLTGFHSDHRLVYLRLTSHAFANLFGQYNFQIYAILNCLLLLPIFYFTVKPLIRQEKFWEIFILSLIVFTSVYYDAILWAHVSSTYTPVLFFAMLAIKELTKEQLTAKNILLCLFLCLFCLGCFGNGLFLFFVIFLLLLVRKQFRFAILWLIVSLITTKIYFIGHIKSDYLQGNDYFGAYLGKFLGFLSLMGSHIAVDKFAVNHNIALGLIVALLLIFYVVKNIKKILNDKSYMRLAAFLTFCLVTLFVIAVGRVGKDEEYLYLIQDRYRFYGVFTLALLMTLYFVRYKCNQITLVVLSIFFATINLLSFLTYKPDLDLSFKEQNCATFNYDRNGAGLSYYYNFEEIASERMQKFTEAGFFTIKPAELFGKINEIPRTSLDTEIQLKEKRNETKFSEKLTIVNYSILLEYPEFVGSSHRLNGCYFLFESDGNSFIFPSLPNPHSGKNIFKNGIGVKATIRKNFFKEGTYKISVVEVAGNEIRAIKDTKQSITI